MNIKVCGITQFKQLKQLEALDLDFAGFHFAKTSPWYLANQVTPKQLAAADFDIKKTGVFCNQSYEEIMELVDSYELDVVQLNGEEPVSLCKKLAASTEIIKTFFVHDQDQATMEERLLAYDEVCDYYLFDNKKNTDEASNVDERFKWETLLSWKIEKPFFIGGDIRLEDAMSLKKFKHPDLYGVDINAGFETATGVKDLTKVLLFKKMLH